MSSGGVVVASDIPVHREVYDDAAEYFDPYSTASLVQAFRKVIYAEDAIARQQHLRERGQDVASRYQPDKILPRWNQFLEWVARDKGAAVLGRSTGASAKPLALRDLDGAASPQ